MKLRKSNATCYAFIADTHSGHELGLINPKTTLYKEGKHGLVPYTPQLNEYNEYDWYDVYEPGVEMIKNFTKGIPLTLIHLSDLTQGQKYVSQWFSTRQADQKLIAEATFTPWLALRELSTVRIVAGTPSHDFGEASAPIEVAEMLRGKTKADVAVVLHGLIKRKDGYEIDYTHHGPGAGIRVWTRGNVLRYYLRSNMISEIAERGRCANLLMRGHVHEIGDESVTVNHKHKARIISMPSLCGFSEHARQVTRSNWELVNGLMAIIVEDGKMQDEFWHVKTLDMRTVENI